MRYLASVYDMSTQRYLLLEDHDSLEAAHAAAAQVVSTITGVRKPLTLGGMKARKAPEYPGYLHYQSLRKGHSIVLTPMGH